MKRLKKYLTNVSEERQNEGVIASLAALDYLEKTHPQVAASIIKELEDQRDNLKLIASENYCSLATQLAMGNWLTDKYAEGFPHHRFYAGCDNVDAIESLAAEEAKKLFGAEHAYVQPHCGADANLIAFWAMLFARVQSKELERLGKKGVDQLTPEEHEQIRQLLVNQKMLGMSLNSGGHLTHGFRMNLTAKLFKIVQYDVDPKTELLDYDEIQKIATREKPMILLAGYSAYPRKINFARMRQIADSVGAFLMVDMAHFAGLVAGKVFTGEFNPIPYADIVTSTTHKTLRGPRGGLILCKEPLAPWVNKGCPIAMGGPLPHVMAAKAVAFREANTPEFSKYAHKIVENAKALADRLKKNGARVTTGGTENHLMVVEVTPFGINGMQAEKALRNAHITVNRNTVPFDKMGAWFTSGIRIGAPAMTTLGMGEKEMQEIADLITLVLKNTKAGAEKGEFVTKPEIVNEVQTRVKKLLTDFPLYPELVL